jgi:hypothetical protein
LTKTSAQITHVDVAVKRKHEAKRKAQSGTMEDFLVFSFVPFFSSVAVYIAFSQAGRGSFGTLEKEVVWKYAGGCDEQEKTKLRHQRCPLCLNCLFSFVVSFWFSGEAGLFGCDDC